MEHIYLNIDYVLASLLPLGLAMLARTGFFTDFFKS